MRFPELYPNLERAVRAARVLGGLTEEAETIVELAATYLPVDISEEAWLHILFRVEDFVQKALIEHAPH